MDYEKHMGLTLLQMNFILGASSMDRVSRVILASMAIQCRLDLTVEERGDRSKGKCPR
jgi:hypothetical protein